MLCDFEFGGDPAPKIRIMELKTPALSKLTFGIGKWVAMTALSPKRQMLRPVRMSAFVTPKRR